MNTATPPPGYGFWGSGELRHRYGTGAAEPLDGNR
jgi:hypothetical protein